MESKVHKLLFVGDVVMDSKPKFSEPIKDAIHSAVVVGCNVEAPLRGFGNPSIKTGPLVNQDPNAVEWLIEAGFNMFSLANNHIGDYGAQGVVATQRAFPTESVIGVGTTDEAYALLIRIIDGVKYGFVAYGENGYGALNGEREVGYAWVNNRRVNQDINAYKEQVDILIVQVHAGVELLDVPIPEWRTRFRELIDCGADLLIAHHPHVVQGIEYYKGKAICYSLGNFYFDYPSDHPEWNSGGILTVLVHDKKIQTIQLDIIEKTGNNILYAPHEKSVQKVNDLNNLISHEGYSQYVDNQALTLWHRYHKAYYAKVANGITDYSFKGILKHLKRLIFNRGVNYNLLWHNLFIESNIWLVQRATALLKNK